MLSWSWEPRKYGLKVTRGVVMHWINSKKGNGGYSAGLVHDIGVWSELIEEFVCSHILREGNMVDVGSKGCTAYA